MSQENVTGRVPRHRVARDVATRQVNWGEALVVAAFHQRGGLNVAVNRIHEVVGSYIGVRNSFAKLLHMESPAQLHDRDEFRAWLLLTALNQRPWEWGIADSAVPPGFDIDRLRAALWPEPYGPDGLEGYLERRRARRDSNPKPSDPKVLPLLAVA